MNAQERKRAFFNIANHQDDEAFGIIDGVRVSVPKARLVASWYNKAGGNTESFFGSSADQVIKKVLDKYGKKMMEGWADRNPEKCYTCQVHALDKKGNCSGCGKKQEKCACSGDYPEPPEFEKEVFAGIDEPPNLAELVKEASSMNDETISSLYVKFHTWATNKSKALPNGAPVLTQILDGMSKVKDEVMKNQSAKGEEAVRLILKAMDGNFTSGAQPIPYLIRKYGQKTIEKLSPHGYLFEDSGVGAIAGFNAGFGSGRIQKKIKEGPNDLVKRGIHNIMLYKSNDGKWKYYGVSPKGAGGGSAGSWTTPKEALKACFFNMHYEANSNDKCLFVIIDEKKNTKKSMETIGNLKKMAGYQDRDIFGDIIKEVEGPWNLKREGMWNIFIVKSRASRWDYHTYNPQGGSFGMSSYPSARAALAAALRTTAKPEEKCYFIQAVMPFGGETKITQQKMTTIGDLRKSLGLSESHRITTSQLNYGVKNDYPFAQEDKKECWNCGEPIVKPIKGSFPGPTFCSDKCKKEYEREQKAYHEASETKVQCKECGRTYDANTYRGLNCQCGGRFRIYKPYTNEASGRIVPQPNMMSSQDRKEWLKLLKGKKMAYGTRDDRWHMIGPDDRDWKTAIDPEEWMNDPEAAKKKYLSPSFIREDDGEKYQCCGQTTQSINNKNERYCQECGSVWKKFDSGWGKLKENFDSGGDADVDHCQNCYGEEHEGSTGGLKKFKVQKDTNNFDMGSSISVCEKCYNELKKQGVLKESLGFGMGTNQIERGMRQKEKTDSMDVYDDIDSKAQLKKVMEEAVASPIDGKEKRSAVQAIYKSVGSILDGSFHDESWKPIHDFFNKLRELNIDYSLEKSEYQHNEKGQTQSKTWTFTIEFVNKRGTQDKIYGRLVAHGAGSVSDPLSRYDITLSLG